MRKAVLLLLMTALLVSAACGISESVSVRFPDGRTISCEIADTRKKMQAGLSSYADLGRDQGMLFVYPAPVEGVSFWMPNRMKFQIDMIFLDGDKRVVMIEHRVPICKSNLMTECPSYGPEGVRVQFVVEIVAGLSEEMGLKLGDALEFELPKGKR